MDHSDTLPPDGIPQDVWDASYRQIVPNLTGTIQESRARAIMADRKRAETAATEMITRLLGDDLADSINGYVAAAIRGEPA